MPTFTDDAWKCDVHYDHRKLGRHCSVINVFVNHQTNTFRLLIFAVFPTFPSFNYLITWIITCDLIYIAFLKIYKTRKQLIQNISHQVFYRPNAFLPFESYAKYNAESLFSYLKWYDYIIKISKCRVSCKFDISHNYDWIQITRLYVICLYNAILQIQVIEIASLYLIINGQYFKNRNVIKYLLNNAIPQRE